MTTILVGIALVLAGMLMVAVFNWGLVKAASSQDRLGALLETWAVVLIVASTVAIFLFANRVDPSILTGAEIVRGSGMGVGITTLFAGALGRGVVGGRM